MNLKDTIKEYAGIICESNPIAVATSLSRKANDYQIRTKNEIDTFLKMIADEGLKDPKHFPIGDGRSIDITNTENINSYIQQIISNLDIDDKTGEEAVLNALNSFKKMLKNVANKKSQQPQILHNKREIKKPDLQLKFKGR